MITVTHTHTHTHTVGLVLVAGNRIQAALRHMLKIRDALFTTCDSELREQILTVHRCFSHRVDFYLGSFKTFGLFIIATFLDPRTFNTIKLDDWKDVKPFLEKLCKKDEKMTEQQIYEKSLEDKTNNTTTNTSRKEATI